MEPNIVLAVTAVIVILAAVILTHTFAPRRNVFMLDLLKAIGEPARSANVARRGAPRHRGEVRGSERAFNATETTPAGELGSAR